MRNVPDGLKAHCAGVATTLATCWRLTRKDGAVLGFTDHDEPLSFGGTRFEAATGLSAGDVESEVGFSAGTQEVKGALSSLSIDEADIRAGRYDSARIETYVVNWQKPEDRVLKAVSILGEVKRGGHAFAAELRDITSSLDQPKGRIYRRRCDAAFGDDRCRMDLSAPNLFAVGVVAETKGSWFRLKGLPPLDPANFNHGRLSLTGGAASGLSADIRSFRAGTRTGEAEITVIEALDADVAAGDAVRLFAGCDRSFSTCRDRFANSLNFRGFPHIPGTDAALGIAKKDGVHDGSPVVP
ncbi:DUF2163 domain-containing protein [Consotaella salsifontis]|uniref:Bacteriophage phiJL001 Gp84 C-terminal domain-containing protein n=1 Tax=Consotaella salsifontis TaxID=1365950 RepID=A0A1T4MDG9_9HYPH|nr:DUF2163 domain-containing protein [Consotaella salsifontis]SJZ64925.1 phage conserved hypothetical protein BR0599 [Consotaella salsifontis]